MGISQLDQYSHEIGAEAAKVGIDWDLASDMITATGWTSKSPALPGYNPEKLSMRAFSNPDGHVYVFYRWQGSSIVERSYWYENAARARNNGRIPPRIIPVAAPPAGSSREKKRSAVLKLWQDNYDKCKEYAPRDFFKNKMIPADTLKLMTDVKGEKCAVVPMMQGDKIVGFEKRYADGRKEAVWGSKKKGSYYLIGCTDYHQPDLAVCSSWSTGMTIHLLTEKPVIIAFSDNNVSEITGMLIREGVTAPDLTYYADNDTFTKTGELRTNGNPGLSVANKLKYKSKIKVRYADFSDVDTKGMKNPSDFNDLYVLAGADEALRQMKESILVCPQDAWTFSLLSLKYSENNTESLLTQIFSHGMKKRFTKLEIEEYIHGYKPGISQQTLDNAMQEACEAIGRRAFWSHKISAKRHKNQKVTFRDINLTREAHGGYSLPDGFYDSIKYFNGIIVVQAPHGVGKTENLARKALEGCKKGAYLAHRIALVEEVSGRLKILSYRDPTIQSTEGITHLACCINSITTPRMNYGHWFDDVEVLVIDEATKVLRHLAGQAIRNQDHITENLLAAMKTARQVVLCDADANSNLIDILSELLPEKNILVCRDEPKMDHISVELSTAKQATLKVERDLNAGKKVLVATDTKADVDFLLNKYKNTHKCIGIHGGTREEPHVKKWIQNPDSESLKYDLVIYNGSVDSGVSLTNGHFDSLIGIFKGIIGITSVIQMMGRDRTARDWFIGCTPIAAQQNRDKKEVIVNSLVMESSVIASSLSPDFKKPKPTSFDIIKLAMEEDDKMSRYDYFLTLRAVLDQKGYRTNIVKETSEAVAAGRETAEIKKAIRTKKIKNVLEAQTPDQEQYILLRDSKNITDTEIAQMTRYEVKETLGIRDISEKHLLFWLNGGKSKAKNFELLSGDSNSFLIYDQFEFQKTSSLTLRNNFYEQSRIIHRMFEMLNIDRKTGVGSFNHAQCREFIDYLYEYKKIAFFNIAKLGPFLKENSPPKCATSFVKNILEKMGLATEKKLQDNKKRLAFHSITQNSWELMSNYVAGRKANGKSIGLISTITGNYEHMDEKDRIRQITDDYFEALIADQQRTGEILE
jgi:hypothetical protein